MPESIVNCELMPQTQTDGTRARTLTTILCRVTRCPHCGADDHIHDLGVRGDQLHPRAGHCETKGVYLLKPDPAELERVLVAFGPGKSDGPKRSMARDTPKPTEPRACVVCGAEVSVKQPGRRGPQQRTCSRECRSALSGHKVYLRLRAASVESACPAYQPAGLETRG